MSSRPPWAGPREGPSIAARGPDHTATARRGCQRPSSAIDLARGAARHRARREVTTKPPELPAEPATGGFPHTSFETLPGLGVLPKRPTNCTISTRVESRCFLTDFLSGCYGKRIDGRGPVTVPILLSAGMARCS